jgi:hypothetical protein
MKTSALGNSMICAGWCMVRVIRGNQQAGLTMSQGIATTVAILTGTPAVVPEKKRIPPGKASLRQWPGFLLINSPAAIDDTNPVR